MKTEIYVKFEDAVEIRLVKTTKNYTILDVRVGNNPWARRTLYRDDSMKIDVAYNGEFS